jgi:dihydroorotate dehydrogenase (NAD+) catalytic subunit
MSKRDLYFSKPLMNAAGMLGFEPPRAATPPAGWELGFGAFVTNPLSLRARKPAATPQVCEYPGGLLMHTGLPNPGLGGALAKHAAQWARADLPVIVHLMADRPEETVRMVRSLENIENVMGVELGFAPQLADDIYLLVLEMCQGELPLMVNLLAEKMLSLGPRLVDAGAAALSLAAPRGAMPKTADNKPLTETDHWSLITGRLFGPSLFPQSLELVYSASKLDLPIVGAGGIYSNENASAMLGAGALAVQLDTILWR